MARQKAAVLVLALLITGCAGIQTGKKMTLLDETTRAYGRAIRWGDYEQAYAFKSLGDKDHKTPDFDDLRQIRVTNYKVRQTILSEDKSKALRIVAIQYYRMSNVTVKNVIDRQKWEYDEEQKRWLLTSELPTFE